MIDVNQVMQNILKEKYLNNKKELDTTDEIYLETKLEELIRQLLGHLK